MEYTIYVSEKLEGTTFKIEDAKGKSAGTMFLQCGDQYKYNGAFDTKELELCQNSIRMDPGSSYVHNIYVDKKESGNIFRSNKRESLLKLTPCRKMYFEGELYYGYEIYISKEILVTPVYRNRHGENKRNEEEQVGLIKLTERTSNTRIYKMYTVFGEEWATLIMALYEYMLSVDTYISDITVTTDEQLLNRYNERFEQNHAGDEMKK